MQGRVSARGARLDVPARAAHVPPYSATFSASSNRKHHSLLVVVQAPSSKARHKPSPAFTGTVCRLRMRAPSQLIWAIGTAWLPQWSPQICVRRPAFPGTRSAAAQICGQARHCGPAKLYDVESVDRRTRVTFAFTPVHGGRGVAKIVGALQRAADSRRQRCGQRVDETGDAAASTVRGRSRPLSSSSTRATWPLRENPLSAVTHVVYTSDVGPPGGMPADDSPEAILGLPESELASISPPPPPLYARAAVAASVPPLLKGVRETAAEQKVRLQALQRARSIEQRSLARRGCAATARPTRRCRSPRSSGWRWRSGCASRRRRLRPPR